MIRGIIIDDEEKSRNVLNGIIEKYIPEVSIVATCESVPDGVLSIKDLQPDVVFLDVEMPKYNGFQLIDFFSEINFEIIFITAYSEYALKAFEVSAVDYILKPIDIEKLETAVVKLKEKQVFSANDRLKSLKVNIDSETFQRIALPVAEGLIFVETSDIISVKADGSYSELHTLTGKPLVISKKIRFFDELLENRPEFFRCHRSHLININHIEKYNRSESMIALRNGLSVHISRDRKSEFEQYISCIRL